MTQFIFDVTQDQQFTDSMIVVNKISSLKNVLSLLQDRTLTQITLHKVSIQTLNDVKLASLLGRVLIDQGTLIIKVGDEATSEADQAFFQILYAGAYLKEIKRDSSGYEFKKTPAQITQLQPQKIQKPKDFINCYGDYDYLKQNFKSLEKKNPFSQFGQGGTEYIDEDQLINDNVQIKQVEACGIKAKACKNCSCGKKEAEQIQDKTVLIQELQTGTIKGSCGSCYLGDAFRCANCPYRGLPSFKVGEKVQLNNNDDQNIQVEITQAQVQNGKVRIQI